MIEEATGIFLMAFAVFTVWLDDKDPDDFWDGFWKAFFMAFLLSNGYMLSHLGTR